MATEIVNELGFDVTQALSALNTLDKALQNVSGVLKGFGTSMDAFNTASAKTSTVLQDIAKDAAAAAKAINHLNGAVSRGSTSLPRSPQTQAPTPQTPQLWLPPGYQTAAQQAAQAGQAAAAAAQAQAQAQAQAGQAATQAGQQATQAANTAAAATNKAAQSTAHWVVSWETMARVVTTQFIVRAMSTARNAIDEAYESAKRFQIAIAQIQTITPALDQNFSMLANEAASFAKEYNVPLDQASAGLYNTISDNFESAADRASVMAAAVRLSKTAVMDFGQAVALITGTLNAYGQSASYADDVAAQFFKTIEIGRVKGENLVNLIGQVAPTAAQAGVSLEELNAALVSLTIGGMKETHAVTGLRAAITAFLKPSDDMLVRLRSMGFESGTQIIRAKTLQGALLAMSEAAGEDAAELAKVLRNVRALNAGLRMTAEGADKVSNALTELKNFKAEELEQVFDKFRSVDTERLTKELNDLKVQLTQDVGGAMIGLYAGTTNLVGGADNLAAAFKGLLGFAVPTGVALGGMAATLLALSANAKLAALGATGLGAAFTGVILPIALVAGGITMLASKAASDVANLNEALRKSALKSAQDLEKIQEQAIKAEQDALEQRSRAYEEAAADIRKSYFNFLDGIKADNKAVVEETRTGLEQMVAAQEKVADQLRTASNQSLTQRTDALKRQASAQAQYDDTRFRNAAKGLSDEEKADKMRQRSMQLAKQAAAAMSTAKTPEAVTSATEMFQRAEAFSQEAESAANATNNVVLQQKAHNVVLHLLRQRVAAEGQLAELSAQQAADQARLAAEQRDNAAKMKSSAALILKDLDLFDKNDPKSMQDRQAALERLRKNFGDLRDEWLKGDKINVSELLGMDSLQQRIRTAFEGSVTDVKVNKILATPQSLADLNRQINEGIPSLKVAVESAATMDPELSAKLKGRTSAEQLAILGGELERSKKKLQEHREATDQTARAFNNMKNAAQAIGVLREEWKDLSDITSPKALAVSSERAAKSLIGGINPTITAKFFAEFSRQAEQFQNTPLDATIQQFEKLQDLYNYIESRGGLAGADKGQLQGLLLQSKIIAESAEAYRTGQQGKLFNEAETQIYLQRINDIEAAMQRARGSADPLQGAMQGSATAASEAQSAVQSLSQTDLSNVVTNAQNLANAMWSAAQAAQAVQVPSGAVQQALGGDKWRFLASGGAAGTDVVPAMLTPGEFVMNANSTRKFASQLVAMNAGVQPTFRSDGGSVTNIGDIHVSVQGSNSGRQTAREIAVELRREMRRGTARF